MLWWAWGAYAWLTNELDPDEGAIRIAMLAATAAMLIVALAVPGAFNENALEFAIAYTFVRVMHIVLYAQAASDPGVRTAILGLAPRRAPSGARCSSARRSSTAPRRASAGRSR